jgi:KaiC/GvpD/RAD55 family RecA-like ATPase
MSRPRKGKLDGLEVELASSVLYYDQEELDRFLEIFDAISSDTNILIDGVFTNFVSFVKKWATEMSGKEWDNPEERRLSMINGVKMRNSQRPNAKEREIMDLWLEKVLETHVPMELAEDIMFHFIWAEFQKAIEAIDRTDLSFAEKLAVRPKIPQLLMRDGVVTLDEIEIEGEKQKSEMTTGLRDLDRIIRFEPGNFVIVAARPGVGKSLFMLHLGSCNAVEGIKCLYLSLEMNKKQINERLMNYFMKENIRERFTDEHGLLDVEGFKNAMNEAKQSRGFSRLNKNLQLYVTSKSSADSILTDVEEQIKQNKYKMVYLDYLQLLRYADQNEWESVRTLTRELKNLATRTGTVIVAGSQVSRVSTERGLLLTDLFGSSTIEADTDIVIGLEEVRERKSGEIALINLKTMKNREGPRDESKYTINYSNGHLQPYDS